MQYGWNEPDRCWIWVSSPNPINETFIQDNLQNELQLYHASRSSAMPTAARDVQFSAGISSVFPSADQRFQAVKQAEAALQRRFYYGYGKVFRTCTEQTNNPTLDWNEMWSEAPQQAISFLNQDALKAYLTGLEGCEDASLQQLFEDCFPASISEEWPAAVVREGVYQWLSSIIVLLKDWGGFLHDQLLAESPFEQISAIETYEELREWCHRLHTVAKDMIVRLKSQQRMEIRKAIEYVRTNYFETIRIQDVARLVNLSENCFSYLFTKETGTSFIHFLQETRVQRAKELLREGVYWVDAGEQVGFETPKYFSKIFKKFTGFTPAQYTMSQAKG